MWRLVLLHGCYLLIRNLILWDLSVGTRILRQYNLLTITGRITSMDKRSKKSTTILLTTIGLVMAATLTYLFQTPISAQTDPTVEEAVLALRNRENLVKSAEGIVKVETLANQDPELLAALPEIMKPKRERTVEQFIWRFDGNRYREESVTIEPDLPETRRIRGYDGSEGYFYEPRDQYYMRVTAYSMAVGPKLEQTEAGATMVGEWLGVAHNYGRATPDANGFYGTPPLSHILLSKSASYVGEEIVNGVICKHFDSGVGTDRTESWWISPENGYALVKNVRTAVDKEKGIETQHETVVTEFRMHEGNVAMPYRAKRTWTMILPGGKQGLISIKTLTVDSLEIKPDFAPNAFKFPPPPGAQVFEDRPEE